MKWNTEEIEQAIADLAGVECAVEVDGDSLVVSGMARTEAERDGALEVARAAAPYAQIVDNIEVLSILPEEIGGMSLSEAGAAGFPSAEPFTSDDEALEPVDMMDQEILQNPEGAAGPSGTAVDEEISEGDEAYVPPTDPVTTPEGEFLGGFQTTSMDPEPTNRGVFPGPGDVALAEEVRAELRQDAATTDLDVEVIVHNGVVHLRGIVNDLYDAENAGEVASRVEGVVAVEDELEVRAI